MDFSLTPEQEQFRKEVREWVDREAPKAYARELERHESTFPDDLFAKMGEAGFHAVGIPEEYGGSGGDIMTQMILARELCRTLGGLAWFWGILSFAGGKSVGLYGTDEQKGKHLPKIARGEEKWAISFTEPGGGTDVLGAMTTRAEKVDGGWVINGTKTWSGMSNIADYLLLLGRTDDDVEKRHQGVTLFIVPAKQDGVRATPKTKLGMRALPSCEVHLEDVFVPDANVLGEPNQAWYMLLPTLNNERIMVAAFCLGIMDGVLEDALAYMHERHAFGGPIGRFQALQHYAADIAMKLEYSEAVTWKAAWKQSQGLDAGREANMAKVIASEAANECADMGIQILGGNGYSGETDMQRYWRDSRLWRIGPITNEMARNVIAEGLGLPRSF